MQQRPYESPAIADLGSLHEQTLSWMTGSAGPGFPGKKGKFDWSGPDTIGGVTINQGHQSRHGKSSKGSGSAGGGDDDGGLSDPGDGGGGRGGRGSNRHHGFNLNDGFKSFGGSD